LIAVSLFKEYDLLPTPPQIEWNPLWNSYVSPLETAKTVDESFLRVTGVDTSGVTATTNTSGGWSAWCTCMLDTTTGNIFVLAVDRARNVSFEELRLRVLAHLGTYNPDLCVIENASQGGRLGESILNASRTPVQLVEARQSKEDRVINILPILEGGRIHIPARAAWRDTFLKELSDFPASRTSDIVDAWCYAVTYCKFALARRRSDELFNQQMGAFFAFWLDALIKT
jgi:predicted phage terminase large subunit-like protein